MSRERKIHVLKSDPHQFDAVRDGSKTFEIRFNDRDYQADDILELHRTKHTGDQMKAGAPLIFTGAVEQVLVTHVMFGPQFGLADGWVIMSIQKAAMRRQN